MKKLLLSILIILTISFVMSCSKSSVNDPEPYPQPEAPKSSDDLKFIGPQTLDSTKLNLVMTQLKDYPEGFDYYDLSKVMVNSSAGASLGYIPGLWYSKITYTSVDNAGQPKELSGLIIYPYDVSHPFKKFSLPLVSFNHATEPQRKFAPSRWGVTENAGDFAETVIAAGLALKNRWCIIMPDYQGMGDDNSEIHPFCNKELLGKAVADLCAKTIAYLKSSSNNTNVTWNNQLFLMGYSEGAFATMSGVRELEARKIDITAAACMSGPYDLTGTMLPVILDPKPFPSPYFLPYMIMGSNAVKVNGTAFDPKFVIATQYYNGIVAAMDMNHSGAEINAAMPASKIVREALSQNFIDSLGNQNSSQFKILENNNTWKDWEPKTKLFIAHGLNDDCVPYGNFVTFKAKHPASATIQYFELGETFKYMETTHLSMAPWAFLQGSTWIQNQVKY